MEAIVVDWQSPYVPLVFRSFHLIYRYMSDPAVDPMVSRVSRVAKHKLTNTHKKSCQRVLTLTYNIEVKVVNRRRSDWCGPRRNHVAAHIRG